MHIAHGRREKNKASECETQESRKTIRKHRQHLDKKVITVNPHLCSLQTQKDGDIICSRVCCDRTRGNDFKLKEGKQTGHKEDIFFPIRVMRHWHRFPRGIVVPHPETPEVRLDGALRA